MTRQAIVNGFTKERKRATKINHKPYQLLQIPYYKIEQYEDEWNNEKLTELFTVREKMKPNKLGYNAVHGR